MSINFEICKAKREDMPKVLKLITELAEFEKMKKEVKICAAELERDAFDLDNPLFHCLVAKDTNSGQVIGYAIYYFTYSTWLGASLYMEDLYVQPQYRKQNVGKGLFLAVAKFAYEHSSRLDFEVLSWNPAMEFYAKFGAVNLTKTETWQRMRLDKQALEKIVE